MLHSVTATFTPSSKAGITKNAKAKIIDYLKTAKSHIIVSDSELQAIALHHSVYKALQDSRPLKVWRDGRKVLCVSRRIRDSINEWYHYTNGKWY